MAASITATVTDAFNGRPAEGLRVQVYWVEPAADVLLRAAVTTAAGTTALPLVSGSKLSAGVYKLMIHAGDYWQSVRPDVGRSVEVVPVVFIVEDVAVGRQITVALRPDGYDVRCV